LERGEPDMVAYIIFFTVNFSDSVRDNVRRVALAGRRVVGRTAASGGATILHERGTHTPF
jgi:hypothetical protein